MRIEPPPSVPSASGPIPAATATAAPPDEPPQVCASLHGLSVRPKNGPSVKGLWPNSGVVVLPMRIAPAARARATATASVEGMVPANRAEPCVVATPSVLIRSFAEKGTPCRGPSGSPRCTAASACLASARARSAGTARKALRSRRASIRVNTASTASTGETVLSADRSGKIAGGQICDLSHRFAPFRPSTGRRRSAGFAP